MTETLKPIVKLKVTKVGVESAINADSRGIKVELSTIKYSSDYFESVVMDERTDLQNIIIESSIEVGGTSEDKRTLRMFSTINAPSSMQINSLGVYTSDGVLFAVASVTEGSLFKVHTGISFVASFGLTFSPSLLERVTVTTDENTALALILMAQHELALDPHPQYLRIDEIPKHIIIPDVPDATTEVKGIVMLVDDLVTFDNTKALTARQGALLALRLEAGTGLGINQTYVTVSRVGNGTKYYNNTGQPIFVTFDTHFTSRQNSCECYVNGVYLAGRGYNRANDTQYNNDSVGFVVPDGAYYQLYMSGGWFKTAELTKIEP